MKRPVFIREIKQVDNHTFCIVWTDDKVQFFRLNGLQQECPCARCRDEKTGAKQIDVSSLKEDVKARSIRSVGRYALQVQFTSGCSAGIYSFDHLRQIGRFHEN